MSEHHYAAVTAYGMPEEDIKKKKYIFTKIGSHLSDAGGLECSLCWYCPNRAARSEKRSELRIGRKCFSTIGALQANVLYMQSYIRLYSIGKDCLVLRYPPDPNPNPDIQSTNEAQSVENYVLWEHVSSRKRRLTYLYSLENIWVVITVI